MQMSEKVLETRYKSVGVWVFFFLFKLLICEISLFFGVERSEAHAATAV